jgi:ADP-ribosylation factor family
LQVDSSDTERIGISREEFHAILSEDELKDTLILVYANKQVGGGAPRQTDRRTLGRPTGDAAMRRDGR